jgi:hypothetical protein
LEDVELEDISPRRREIRLEERRSDFQKEERKEIRLRKNEIWEI